MIDAAASDYLRMSGRSAFQSGRSTVPDEELRGAGRNWYRT